MLQQEQIKRVRETIGITQNELAKEVGVSRVYLSQIERGDKACSEDLLSKIDIALFNLNTNTRLDVLFDYVRVRFPFPDKERNIIFEEVLRLKERYFTLENHSFFGYARTYSFGNLRIFTSDDEERGILIEFSGKSCREFEYFLKVQKRSWEDFFYRCLDFKGVFKRIDIAIDDKYYILDIPFLIEKAENEEIISVFRNFRIYKSGGLNKNGSDKNVGNTLYIGSAKSEVQFCIYEKDYEQMVKMGYSLDETETKNRFEIRLKNERAETFINHFLNYNDLNKVVFSIINRYIKVVDNNGSSDKKYFPTNYRWECFLNDVKTSLKLTTEPKEYDIKDTYNWLFRQVAPTLSMVSELDKVFDTENVSKMLNTRLGDRQEKIISRLLSDIEDVIL